MILGVMLVVACGESTSEPTVSLTDPSTAPTTTSTSVPSTTTNSAPITTSSTVVGSVPDPIIDPDDLTHPDAPPPEVDLEADTWAELLLVWQDIERYWVWMYSHPSTDPAHLSVVLHPDGPEFEQQMEGMAQLVENDWRIVSDSIFGQILGFGCCPDADARVESGQISIVVTATAAPESTLILDGTGETVSSFEGFDRMEFEAVLRRDQEGSWRVWQFGS